MPRPSDMNERTENRSLRAGLAVAALAALTLLGACSSGGDSVEDSNADAGAGDSGLAAGRMQDQDTADGLGFEAASEAGSDQPSNAATAADLVEDVLAGRTVIRTASMTLIAEDVDDTRLRVADVIDGVGGVIASETTSTVPGAEERGDVRTVRLGLQVPTYRFDATVKALSDLGTVRQRAIRTEDVTTEVADVDSRVESAQAALTRIRALLDRANSLGSVIRLESELSERQADVESLLAQQRALAGQTRLATIDLELTTERRPEPKPDEEVEDKGFFAGLAQGWDALRGFLLGLSTAVGVLLPFAAVTAVLVIPVLVRYRRRGLQPISPPPAT